ncbi:MAG: hypothetical protein RIS64_3258 [Bacteroidota bacterium]
MLTLFRTNQAVANIIVLAYLFIIRFSLFTHAFPWNPDNSNAGVPSLWIFQFVSRFGLNPALLSLALIFVQAFYINLMYRNYRATQEVTLLPGVFYALAASLIPEFMNLSPILLANTFLLLAIENVYSVYRANDCADKIFNIGFWIGVASLFQFSFTMFLVAFFVGLTIMRGFRLNEFLMFFIGFFVPHILLSVYMFWTNQLGMMQQNLLDNLGFFNVQMHHEQFASLKIILVSILIAFVLITSGLLYSKRNVTAQKYVSILYWVLFAALGTILMQSHISLQHFLILSVPLGILLSFCLQSINSNTTEMVHLLIVVAALLLQYQHILLK